MFNFQRGNSAPWAGLLDGSELSNGQLISPEVSHTEDIVPSRVPSNLQTTQGREHSRPQKRVRQLDDDFVP
jgi:hypothetical protein